MKFFPLGMLFDERFRYAFSPVQFVLYAGAI